MTLTQEQKFKFRLRLEQEQGMAQPTQADNEKQNEDSFTEGYQLPSSIEKAAQLITTPIRGFRGIGVGIQKSLENVNPLKFIVPGLTPSSQEMNQVAGNLPGAIERAAEAVKPGFVPRKGERLGSTLGEAASTAALLGPLSELAPAKLGAQMAIGAGTGGGLSALTDASEQGRFNPISTIGNAALGGALPFIGSKVFSEKAAKAAGATGRLLSGVEQKSGERLFNDPGAFYSPTLEKAGEKLGGFRTEKGLNPIKRTTKELLDTELSLAKKTIDKTEKMLETNPEALKPIDILKAKQAVDDVIKKTTLSETERRAGLFELKNKFTDALENIVPGDKAAAEEYARSALASKFRRILPVTKQGDISLSRTIFAPLLGSGGGGIAALGASPAALGTALASTAIQSPVLSGLGISTAGAATKAAQAALNTPLVKPAIQAVVKTLTEDKARKYLRKAKGDKDKARSMAEADGYEIPE